MFKVAFRVAYRIKGRCSRHPSYNPVKDEQGGIKGGCGECHALFHAYLAYFAFRETIEEFETTVQLFITNKPARGRSGDVRRPFAPELSLPSTRRRTRGNGDAIAPEVISESGK
jgi:hypothetical protein